MAKHQRSLKNLLISPVEQFAFGFRILIAPLMVVLMTLVEKLYVERFLEADTAS